MLLSSEVLRSLSAPTTPRAHECSTLRGLCCSETCCRAGRLGLSTWGVLQGKLLQLRLPLEVQSGQSKAQRSAASKRLMITMPVLHAQQQQGTDITCLRYCSA